VTAADRYLTPVSFRRALTDRLKRETKRSRWTVPQLQRQVAYDRLLGRLYLTDDGWIVKGATALLARDLGTRGTLDIDIYRQAAREAAEADLRRAAAIDAGDWFRFEIGPGAVLGTAGIRLPVNSVIGATTWARFRVDLVGAGVRMTGQPEDVPPLARGVIPEVDQRGYKAYPLIDHVADKVAATYERHGEPQKTVDPVPRPGGPCVHRDGSLGTGRRSARSPGLGVPAPRAAIARDFRRPGSQSVAGGVRCGGQALAPYHVPDPR
jgi:hypothetical protein